MFTQIIVNKLFYVRSILTQIIFASYVAFHQDLISQDRALHFSNICFHSRQEKKKNLSESLQKSKRIESRNTFNNSLWKNIQLVTCLVVRLIKSSKICMQTKVMKSPKQFKF